MMARTNFHFDNCPSCGINILEYIGAKRKLFEETNANEIERLQKHARQDGVFPSIFYGLLLGTAFLLIAQSDQHSGLSFFEGVTLYCSQHPFIVDLGYSLSIATLLSLNCTGRVYSREEQEMWEQFLMEQSRSD